MDQLAGFLLHPPLSEIAKKLGKMLKYTPHFQSAFGTAACRIYNIVDTEVYIYAVKFNTFEHCNILYSGRALLSKTII